MPSTILYSFASASILLLVGTLLWSCNVSNPSNNKDARLFFSVPFRFVMTYLVCCTLLMLISTYILSDKRDTAIPPISSMFDLFPGNFLSRLLISQIAFLLALSQLVFFNGFNKPRSYDNTNVGLARKNLDRVFLVVGLFACLGLSVTGAVCDDDSGLQCQGSHVIHSIGAGLFFSTYTINMIILSGRSSNNHTIQKGYRNKYCGVLLGLAIFSLFSKLRLIPAIIEMFKYKSEIVPTLFEWLDITAILIWTMLYFITETGDFQIQVRQQTTITLERGTMTLSHFSASAAYVVVAVLLLLTLILSLVFVTIYSPTFISDTFQSKPGNMISRFSIPLIATISTMIHVCIYYLDGMEAGNMGEMGRNLLLDKFILMLAQVSMVGFAVLGCSSQVESFELHQSGAGVFYFGYGFFSLLHCLRTFHVGQHKYRNSLFAVQLLLAISSLTATILVAIAVPKYQQRPRPRPSTTTFVFEFYNIVAIFSYMGTCLYRHKYKQVQAVGISVVHLGENEEDERLL